MSRTPTDPAGRPLDREGEPAVASLTDAQLTAELTIAGMSTHHERDERYGELLAERTRRQADRLHAANPG